MALPDASGTGTKKPEKQAQDREITVFKKNLFEEVRVKLVNWKGQDYLDVRVWFKGDADEFFPTKKGLTIGVELIPKFLDALQEATMVLKKAEGKRRNGGS